MQNQNQVLDWGHNPSLAAQITAGAVFKNNSAILERVEVLSKVGYIPDTSEILKELILRETNTEVSQGYAPAFKSPGEFIEKLEHDLDAKELSVDLDPECELNDAKYKRLLADMAYAFCDLSKDTHEAFSHVNGRDC